MSVVATVTVVGLSLSTFLGTIRDAVSLIKDIPGAAEALSRINEAILNLAGKESDSIDEESALGQLAKSEEENLKRLIAEFSDIMNRADLDDYTKDMHRKRIAARLCRLLQLLHELLKDYIGDYEKMREVFCSYAEAA